MKQIRKYLTEFYHEQYNLPFLIYFGVFLALCIAANYSLDFEDTFLDSFLYQPMHVPLMFAFYSLAYYVPCFLYARFYRRTDFLQNAGFWALSLFAIAILTIRSTFYYQNQYYAVMFDESTFYFVRKISNNIMGFTVYFLPVAMFWWQTERRIQPLYGFRTEGVNFKPYFAMLLIMLPLIMGASFLPDFQEAYPRYRLEYDQSENAIAHFWIHELVYGLNFISVEFLFRGFMVLAFTRYLGPGAIFPMVSAYAFLHFGKPLGETIGSVFGGTILGIITYYSRSIWGGVIVHIGVAYLMDFTAFLQHFINNGSE